MRPESITLAAGHDGGGENCFAGQVRQVAFMGSWYEYLVDVAGTDFLVHVPAAVSRNSFKAGDAVSLAWRADDVVQLSV
ncbi:MAG: TOBE domain-containing protein [Proteobacteria bacterium]|nr:TOBE domain-containing protein [Pseudomonadota bacterium]